MLAANQQVAVIAGGPSLREEEIGLRLALEMDE